jgi:hypothetical protein
VDIRFSRHSHLMTGRTVAIIMVFALAVGCSANEADAPTLCEIAARPQAYADRQLSIEGDLLMSRHGTIVTDARCEGGVVIGWRGETPGLVSLNNFARRWDLDPFLQARVRVTGRMVRDETPFQGMLGWHLNLIAGEIIGPVRRGS